MSFLSFPRSFQEHFSCVSSCPILFWHVCRELCVARRGGEDAEADLGLRLACWLQAGPRLPPPLCLSLRHSQGHHWSARRALCSCSLGRAFREIDGSQFPADWATLTCPLVPPRSTLTPLVNYCSRPSAGRGQGHRWVRGKEKEKGRGRGWRRRGAERKQLSPEWGTRLTCAKKLGPICSLWIEYADY